MVGTASGARAAGLLPADSVRIPHALKGMDGIKLDPPEGKTSELATYDLVITDSEADLARESTTYLTIGIVPKELTSRLKIGEGNVTVVDWKRDTPLMQHVQLREVLMVDDPILEPGVTDSTLEELGFETLCHGERGPLILERQSGPRLYLHWMFKLDRTTLPYRLAFPILTTNLVNLSLRQAALAEVKAASTGLLPAVKLERETTYVVTNPSGEHVTTKSDADGWVSGLSARSVGPYEIRSDGKLVRELGVSLLNPTETSMNVVEAFQTKEATVTATEEKLDQDKPIWSSMAAIALFVLLLEWWYFQKRPGECPYVLSCFSAPVSLMLIALHARTMDSSHCRQPPVEVWNPGGQFEAAAILLHDLDGQVPLRSTIEEATYPVICPIAGRTWWLSVESAGFAEGALSWVRDEVAPWAAEQFLTSTLNSQPSTSLRIGLIGIGMGGHGASTSAMARSKVPVVFAISAAVDFHNYQPNEPVLTETFESVKPPGSRQPRCTCTRSTGRCISASPATHRTRTGLRVRASGQQAQLVGDSVRWAVRPRQPRSRCVYDRGELKKAIRDLPEKVREASRQLDVV